MFVMVVMQDGRYEARSCLWVIGKNRRVQIDVRVLHTSQEFILLQTYKFR